MNVHVIETDFEPDDAMAIYAHASINKGIELYVIVGEGNTNSKIMQVKQFINFTMFDYPDAYKSVNIIKGFGTNDTKEESENILKNYKQIYDKNDKKPSISYMMKPPREAIKLCINCPETTIYCYGSFNWRTLGLCKENFINLMSKYKKFYYYDSFSTIGEINYGLYEGTNAHIKNMILKWNRSVLKKCKSSLEEYSKKESISEKESHDIKRIAKIVESISTGIDKQFIYADICLMLCPVPTKQVSLESFDYYPVWKKSKNSNVYIHEEKNKYERLENLKKMIKNIFI